VQNKHQLLTALFVLSFFAGAFSQVSQVARFELPVEAGYESYRPVSAGKSGIVLFRNIDASDGGQIHLIRLDTAFNETWKGLIHVEKNLLLLHSIVKDDLLFLLFKARNVVSGDFLIVTVSLDKGNYNSFIVKNLIPFSPSQFMVTKNAALIGGYFNYRPLVVYYNFTQQQSRILPGFFNEPGELNQVRTNEDGSIDIIVSGKNIERRNCLWLRNYDSEGNLIKTIVLQPEEKRHLIFGSSMQVSKGEQVVSGVYGRYMEYSRGLFVSVVNEIGEYTIRYYNFAELQRFFNYMKAARERRVKNRIERRKIKGKKTKFNYRLLVHELIPYKDQYILVGEAFYPHYSQSSSSSFRTFSYATRSSPALYRDGLIFDGYQYTHAVVIGFDKNGKLLWDNSFEINDVRTMQLQQFIKVQPEKDRIVLLYLFQNALRSKIIKDSEVIEGKMVEDLEEKTPKGIPKVKSIETSRLDYWYDSYFYVYGTETLNSGLADNKPKPRVFFINKIIHK
jgi:hypothetical protein